MNRRSYENKNKRRLSISTRDEVNYDLVSLSVDGSHEDMGQHKGIHFLFPPPKPTAYLTATSNFELFQ